MKRHTLWLGAFLSTLCSLAPIWSKVGADDLIKGDRFWFSKRPSWTHSGVWGPGDTLILADVLRSNLKVYSAGGNYQGTITAEIGDKKLTRPMVIHEAPGLQKQFWVEDEDGRFFLLNSRNRAIKMADLEKLAKGSTGDLRAVYQWTPLDNGDFFIFGDISKGTYGTSAFLKVPAEHPKNFQVLEPLGLDDPARRFYLLGMPYLASIKGVPYYITMDQEACVTSPGRERIALTLGHTKQAIRRPQLPQEKGRLASKAVFQALEESTLPAGIYGWHDFLYILIRTPAGQGRTAWSLSKLEPKTGNILWRRPIDSTANHLMVVPGGKYWAFIEKGPVEEAGLQEIHSFLRVPAGQLEH